MSLGHTGDRSFPWKIPIFSPVGVLVVQMIYQRHSFQYHDPALSVQCLLIPISGAHFVFLSLVLHTNKKKNRERVIFYYCLNHFVFPHFFALKNVPTTETECSWSKRANVDPNANSLSRGDVTGGLYDNNAKKLSTMHW